MKCLTHLPNVKLEHRVAMHYQWWSINEKILILWKLISIGSKLSNDIACNFNFNFNQMYLKTNQVQIGGEGIENMFMNMVLEKTNLYKYAHAKATPFHPSLLGNGINIF